VSVCEPVASRQLPRDGQGDPRADRRTTADWLAWPSALLAGVCLAACTTTAHAPESGDGSPLVGRMTLRVDDQPPRQLSADFELTGNAAAGQLLLSGPLGSAAARARWSAERATLTTPEQSTDFADLDALTQATLGERIPMAPLFDWLRGRPWPQAGAGPRADGLPGFEQLGWQIGLTRWSEGRVDIDRKTPPAVRLMVLLEAGS
jgi:outer membrane lipoprotein LolB